MLVCHDQDQDDNKDHEENVELGYACLPGSE